MRNPKRIKVFLENVDLNHLFYERWKINKEEHPDLVKTIMEYMPDIEDYWHKYPDLRFGQMLIGQELIPDTLKIWNDEESWLINKLKI